MASLLRFSTVPWNSSEVFHFSCPQTGVGGSSDYLSCFQPNFIAVLYYVLGHFDIKHKSIAFYFLANNFHRYKSVCASLVNYGV